ncbi:Sister chromatid cohesion complex Cohesin, subunit RAD21/SCC1 [Phaffia rhodozyma]|uniref:Sister chromatid cohesion complex Cohesin, subunit RAD21/SCC1 n=1 Tax=Phaffia rhodozyma TaxID=264483 RepID=A0A0F7SMQ4_PHARH|nr:Sister chromatid cohesion complex Cohesin, subunit RAD21/SCC1 [Phaffia rhodozyma]
MIYSDFILNKKGALAKVWLAAHMESKLTKLQVGSVDVEQSVNDILRDQVEPMALRLSGQLLLGVCRIYSRKAKYLLDDCTEALVTLKMQIRPSLVDLPEDQLAASNIDITVDGGAEFGFDLDWNVPLPDLFAPLNNLSEPGALSVSSFSGPRRSHYSFDVGPSDGFNSHDFDIDLELDVGDDADETLSAVEYGRDAAPLRSARESLGSRFGGSVTGGQRGDISILGGEGDIIRDPFGSGLDPLDFEAEPMDLGLDIGSPREELEDPFGLGRGGDDQLMGEGLDYDYGEGLGVGLDELNELGLGREGRASSRLSTPTLESSLHTSSIAGNLTPRTAAQIAAAANRQDTAADDVRRRKTVRIIVDATTELESESLPIGSQTTASQSARASLRDLSTILRPQKFIPASSAVLALQSIRKDPAGYFLPVRQVQGGEPFFYAGPKGLGGQLEGLFMFSVGGLTRRREGSGVEGRDEGAKRARTTEGEDDDEVELGRRRDSSRAPSVSRGGRASSIFAAGERAPYVAPDEFMFQDFGGGQQDDGRPPFADDEEIPLDQFDDLAPLRGSSLGRDFEEEEVLRNDRSRAGSRARSVAFSDVDEADLARGARRARSSRGGSLTRSLGVPETEEGESTSAREREKGRAVELLLQQLKVSDDNNRLDENKVVSFQAANERVSRRVASAFFFELLVLGTKDKVKLSQSEPYGDISIQGKEALFQNVSRAAQSRISASASVA